VAQVPGTDFTATGTTLTFTTAPANGVAILVMFLGRSLDIGTPGDSTVTLAKMAANSIDSDQYVDGSIDAVHLSANSVDSDAYVDASIDNAHLADDAVGVAELSATGTASSSTFLRGDNAWAAAGGGDCVFLSSTTASAASSIDITSADGLDSSLYSHYGVYIGGVYCTTTSQSLVMRLSDSDGSSYDTATYNYAARGITDAGDSGDTATAGGTYIRVVAAAGENNTTYAVWGWVWIPVSVGAAPIGAAVTWHTAGLSATEDYWVQVGTGVQTTAPDSGGWDAFQFLPHSAGNLTGTVHIYGYKKS
jgi:hypothetical protein